MRKARIVVNNTVARGIPFRPSDRSVYIPSKLSHLPLTYPVQVMQWAMQCPWGSRGP